MILSPSRACIYSLKHVPTSCIAQVIVLFSYGFHQTVCAFSGFQLGLSSNTFVIHSFT